ncbi:hypothetical protein [Paenibacillus sp. sgz500958]|uniref:hypothetical protein n=1 Tax=Paenibacillus sp. sgz500958 TaxID=3242475 RepID=UPI0036D2283C
MSALTENARRARELWSSSRRILLLISLLLLVIAAVAGWSLQSYRPNREAFHGLPHLYSYREAISSGQTELCMMAVNPDNIVLRAAGSPLRPIAAYGINGGFFYRNDLLSIAIMNDVPVSGVRNAYGSGWFNAKYPRGTLVWDGKERQFSVQVVSSGDEIAVSDRNHYFAQGGISMNLADEAAWLEQATQEHLPFADERRMRSGLIYNNAGDVWLIVTPTLCTAAEFRTAILETVPGDGREGIFLDGDGSSQMNADEAVLPGDSRPVVQMIAIDGG